MNSASGSVRPAQADFCAPQSIADQQGKVVTAWKTAPGDALITHPISGLSVRQSFAPHWSGKVVRLRLSNRYSSVPVTFSNIHLAREATPGGADMVPGTSCNLTFNGLPSVTLQAGETAQSDWVSYPVEAFERLGVSFYAPGPTPQLTRHLNANEVLYISLPGDYSASADGAMYQPAPQGYTANFLVIEALEVLASPSVSTVVAVGDSITDGSDSTTAFLSGRGSPLVATDQRYPNHLQRRFNRAGLPFSVANAGIGGNELLRDGWLPQFGKALLTRFDADVLATAGASHVLVMIGTNDFGNPKTGQAPTSEQLVEGYKQLIARAQRAGLKTIVGTIPPAEGTVTELVPVLHGTAAARLARDQTNAWIRSQTLSDGVVDFAACLEDPLRPGYLAPQFNSGDNLHPNPAGYAAMAECVNLNLFKN
ncbi:GDSL-type esterase/lipase family protein [Limnobacter sp.]|uniref:GDSL-type esterase/lipase family protein n=1 Tax=Limnobacter sp. TaxID=2003368 RepID=UPI003518E085